MQKTGGDKNILGTFKLLSSENYIDTDAISKVSSTLAGEDVSILFDNYIKGTKVLPLRINSSGQLDVDPEEIFK